MRYAFVVRMLGTKSPSHMGMSVLRTVPGDGGTNFKTRKIL